VATWGASARQRHGLASCADAGEVVRTLARWPGRLATLAQPRNHNRPGCRLKQASGPLNATIGQTVSDREERGELTGDHVSGGSRSVATLGRSLTGKSLLLSVDGRLGMGSSVQRVHQTEPVSKSRRGSSTGRTRTATVAVADMLTPLSKWRLAGPGRE